MAGMELNLFLDDFDQSQRWILAKCYLQATRIGRFGPGRHRDAVTRTVTKQILGRSIRKAASELAKIFRRNNRPSPFHDEVHTNRLDPCIRDLLQAYDSMDPAPNREEAVTNNHLRLLHKYADTHALQAQADLLIGAFFYAKRSCEYSAVPVRGQTKLLQVGDIVFTDKNHRVVLHSDKDLFKLN